MNRVIVTITGPSGAGKSTLERMLVTASHGRFQRLMSCTTRQPRPGETNGVDYRFLNETEFETIVARGEMLEHVRYNGARYGVSTAEVMPVFASDKVPIIVCEPNGRDQIALFAQGRRWEVIKVWIDNPLPVLLERLVDRFVAELENNRDYRGARKRLVDRLHVSQVDESRWRAEAEQRRNPYDIRIHHFDEANDEAMVDQIIRAVQMRQQLAA